jgi:hypothetical protein
VGRFCRLMRFRPNRVKDLEFFERGQMICYFCIQPIWVCTLNLFCYCKVENDSTSTSTSQGFDTVYEGKIWRLFFVTFREKVDFCNGSQVYCLWPYGKLWAQTVPNCPKPQILFHKNSSPRNLCKKSLTSVLFRSTCRLFQIANEGDFRFLCTVTFWQKVDFLISNVC